MSKKNYFYGKYYKFVNNDESFIFAMIVAYSNEGKSIQVITSDGAHYLKDPNKVIIYNEHDIYFDINQEDIRINGHVILNAFHPLKRHVMGPFHYIPFMECKHEIYSMYHTLNGELEFNGTNISFNNGHGYIEGDKGVNFPTRYVWYNSSKNNLAVTFAIASIPFGLFSFTGILCFIKTEKKEYYLSTYNFAKVKCNQEDKVVIKKGNYTLEVNISPKDGHKLKAPVKGNMVRYIKENVSISSVFTLKYKDKVIISNSDENSSFEWVWDNN